jgi:hypothetical protein
LQSLLPRLWNFAKKGTASTQRVGASQTAIAVRKSIVDFFIHVSRPHNFFKASQFLHPHNPCSEFDCFFFCPPFVFLTLSRNLHHVAWYTDPTAKMALRPDCSTPSINRKDVLSWRMLCPSTRSFVGLLRSAQSSGRYGHEVVARAERIRRRSHQFRIPKTDRLPLKTGLSPPVPTDPLIYRFHESSKSMAANP